MVFHQCEISCGTEDPKIGGSLRMQTYYVTSKSKCIQTDSNGKKEQEKRLNEIKITYFRKRTGTFSTKITLVRFLPSVTAHVDYEIGGVVEATATVQT